MTPDTGSEQPLWLFSRRADFWLACGGASAGLLAALLVIGWHGDRELDWLDFVLAELHLGATYDAVIRRRLWRHRPTDVLVVPLVILALTYALAMSEQMTLLTSIAMYAAVWHRGRQSLGVARFYQRAIGGPVSRAHDCLFRGAIYLPMLAGMLTYTQLAPTEYEGEPYFALSVGAGGTSIVALAAVVWVIAYFAWTLWRSRCNRLDAAPHEIGILVHPGEWWVVLAHAVAFGSTYALGASNASFLLALGIYHEVQYLYFTCAMARRPARIHVAGSIAIKPAIEDPVSHPCRNAEAGFRSAAAQAVSFAVWPIIGLAGAIAGGWAKLEWLAPLGMGGLFCHYWLDGRIWTRQSFRG